MKVHLVTGSVFFSPSVEVNNFLKIDENQNEEVENDDLPDSPVSPKCFSYWPYDSSSFQNIQMYL